MNLLGTGAGSFLYGLKNEQSQNFDGVDEEDRLINVPSSLQFDFADAHSISLWVKRATSSDEWILSTCRTDNSQGHRLRLEGTGALFWNFYNNFSTRLQFDTNATQPCALNTWAHVVITYDGSSDISGVTLYVDDTSTSLGTTTNTASGTISYNSSNRVSIASRGSNAWGQAEIDQLAFYNKELSAAEVSEIYNGGSSNIDLRNLDSATNLVNYYPIGELDDFTDPDVSNGKTSAGTFQTGSQNFDGVDDRNDAGAQLTDIDFDYTDPFSVTYWIKLDAAGASEQHILCYLDNNGGSNTNGWRIMLNGSEKPQIRIQQGSNRVGVSYDTVMGTGTWEHHVWTYDGSDAYTGFKFYLDGESKALVSDDSGSPTSISYGSTHQLQMGVRNTGNFINAHLDQVAIYTRELTQHEVDALYNNGSSDYDYNDLSISSVMPCYYPLDEGTGDETDTALTEKIDDFSDAGNTYDLTPVNTEAGDLASEYGFNRVATIEDVINGDNLNPTNTEEADLTTDIA